MHHKPSNGSVKEHCCMRELFESDPDAASYPEWLLNYCTVNGQLIQQYRKLITAAHDILCICKLILNEPTPILGIGIEAEIVTLFNAISEESSFANQIN